MKLFISRVAHFVLDLDDAWLSARNRFLLIQDLTIGINYNCGVDQIGVLLISGLTVSFLLDSLFFRLLFL
jgi:hypothetical protein